MQSDPSLGYVEEKASMTEQSDHENESTEKMNQNTMENDTNHTGEEWEEEQQGEMDDIGRGTIFMLNN